MEKMDERKTACRLKKFTSNNGNYVQEIKDLLARPLRSLNLKSSGRYALDHLKQLVFNTLTAAFHTRILAYCGQLL
ncbi:hypothetical protein V1478_012956, partial [Vespula squamosa]